MNKLGQVGTIGGLMLVLTLLGASAIMFSSVSPFAIAVLDSTIYVKTAMGMGISGARVDCYQHDFFGGVPTNPSFTTYTDASGMAVRRIAQGIYTIKIRAEGYEDLEAEVDARSTVEVGDTRTFTFVMTAGSWHPPVGTTAVEFYLVSPSNDRVSGYITPAGESAILTDEHGHATLYLTMGYHSFRFHGWYQKSGAVFGSTQFDFTGSANIAAGQTYTVNVGTGTTVLGNPPEEPTDPYGVLWAILGWIMAYWWVILIIVACFWIFAILFQGTGPQLLKMYGGRRR